ncbi:MAG: hypothetical protein A2270_05955 [Elusimicrobia bacterium RIFOXYA12_FULL_51_18]|nr:MAG: hypothetical protein A2270_05955 [Elusimicrobia bacterium RIFOXYA12_FULL_51_18]OGS30515.1 MAG: hypothetical protein A2218_04350 [Elusimicrobia bacterium RIFOXYA2_FULL_53_38]
MSDRLLVFTFTAFKPPVSNPWRRNLFLIFISFPGNIGLVNWNQRRLDRCAAERPRGFAK